MVKLSLSLKATNNSVIKHSYQIPESVEVYEEAHYITEEIKKSIAKYIFSSIDRRKKGLKILDAGIGGGDLVLLPLLDEIIKTGLEVQIVGIDNSKPMLSRLDGELTTKRKFKKIEDNEKITYKSGKISISIYIYDLEEYSLPGDLNGINFDIILSILTLHHLKNWRLVLSTLIKHLDKNGKFIIFEWTKGIKLRDGNFMKDDDGIEQFDNVAPTNIIEFWKEFYKKRKEYHLWSPEICSSNYNMVKTVLTKYLEFNEISKEFEWVQDVNWDSILKWINKKAYSNFYRGLTERQQRELIRFVERYNNKQPTKWTEKLGCKITILASDGCVRHKSKKVTELVQSSLLESSIYKKIIWDDERSNNLLQFSTLLVQHDFLTENTLFFTLNKWDMIENTWDRLDKPMIINKSGDNSEEFLKSILMYYGFIEKFEMSATDLIFRDFNHKPILVIKKKDTWSVDKCTNKHGIIEKLEISVPIINRHEINDYDNSICISSEGYIPIKEDILNIDINQQNVKDYINEIKNKIPNNFFDNYKNNIIQGKEALRDTFLSLLPDEEKLENFVKIMLLHSLIIAKWDTAVYIPAISLLSNSYLSLGGFVIFENNGTREDLKKCLEERINVLQTVINLKFRELGIVEYARRVKYEINLHGLRSAVAAIMSRNMSHNIGSHVLNYLSNPDEIDDLWIDK